MPRTAPLLLSVLWFSIFACLAGFSTSYAMLFALRALFGLGMGGEWGAGMPLVMEHWPTRLRGLASGLLLGGWYWGYLLAAAAFQSLSGSMITGAKVLRRSARVASARTQREVTERGDQSTITLFAAFSAFNRSKWLTNPTSTPTFLPLPTFQCRRGE